MTQASTMAQTSTRPSAQDWHVRLREVITDAAPAPFCLPCYRRIAIALRAVHDETGDGEFVRLIDVSALLAGDGALHDVQRGVRRTTVCSGAKLESTSVRCVICLARRCLN